MAVYVESWQICPKHRENYRVWLGTFRHRGPWPAANRDLWLFRGGPWTNLRSEKIIEMSLYVGVELQKSCNDFIELCGREYFTVDPVYIDPAFLKGLLPNRQEMMTVALKRLRRLSADRHPSLIAFLKD